MNKTKSRIVNATHCFFLCEYFRIWPSLNLKYVHCFVWFTWRTPFFGHWTSVVTQNILCSHLHVQKVLASALSKIQYEWFSSSITRFTGSLLKYTRQAVHNMSRLLECPNDWSRLRSGWKSLLSIVSVQYDNPPKAGTLIKECVVRKPGNVFLKRVSKSTDR